MKTLSYFVTIPGVMSLLTPVLAAEIWATGVSATEGWIDYEKQKSKNDGDDNLCWAASSANIIDFWQQHYIVPEGTPTGAAIWERFKTAGTTDTGGNFVFAIQWWLGGDYEGTTLDNNVYGDNLTPQEVLTHADNRAIARHSTTDVSAIKTDLDTFGGYYWSTIPQTYDGTPYVNSRQKHLFNFVWFARQDVQPVPTNGSYDAPALLAEPTITMTDTEDAEENIASMVSVSPAELMQGLELGGPLSLAIVDTNHILAHAITLWGIEYEGDAVSSIWITDSDDYQTQLRQVTVNQQTNNGITTLFLKDYSTYAAYGDIYITEASGVNFNESNTWSLQQIPEPATASLGLLSLAGLAARRRRK